jgi:hypothetical protein
MREPGCGQTCEAHAGASTPGIPPPKLIAMTHLLPKLVAMTHLKTLSCLIAGVLALLGLLLLAAPGLARARAERW